MHYKRRKIDDVLDECLKYFPALAIEGPKGVGKTETAVRRAAQVLRLDDPAAASFAEALFANESSATANGTIVLDEWQYLPELWNKVRRAVDDGATPGSFILTGSAAPSDAERLHSGAGRIDSVRMRPFTFGERSTTQPLLNIADLLDGQTPDLAPGQSSVTLAEYATALCSSGFPGIFELPAKLRTRRLDGYIERIVSKEFAELGVKVRKPPLVLAWLRAYAAATSTTASYGELLDAATPGEGNKPSRKSSQHYRDLLEQLMIVEPLPAWLPVGQTLSTLAKAPKHHLCDPGLAARLLNLDEQRLLDGSPQSSSYFAALFESLTVLTARVAAENLSAKVYHLRTYRGDREIDIIVEGTDGTVVAIEVKLSAVIRDDDVKHLRWLQENHPRPVTGIVVHAGSQYYRRPDGIYVLPLAALG